MLVAGNRKGEWGIVLLVASIGAYTKVRGCEVISGGP